MIGAEGENGIENGVEVDAGIELDLEGIAVPVVVLLSGTKGPGRADTTGGNRYNLHQLILPEASKPVDPEPSVGRGVRDSAPDSGIGCIREGSPSETGGGKGDVAVDKKS